MVKNHNKEDMDGKSVSEFIRVVGLLKYIFSLTSGGLFPRRLF